MKTPTPAANAEASVVPSTEERIREAARRVFLAKGYDGTTSRDLAEASGLNVAMTNYYFRSKAKLFQLTFEDFHRKFFEKMDGLINKDIPLREKVALMIDYEYETVEANPNLPMFVMYEMRRNPELFLNLKPRGMVRDSLIVRQVEQAIAKGEMKPVSPVQIMLLITSNVQHPFMAKALMNHALNLDDAGFVAIMAQHKLLVKDMLLTYLFGPEKES